MAKKNKVMNSKKDIDYYLSLPYKLEITPDLEEGGLVAEYPELPGCITCADSMDKLIIMAEDAKRSWLNIAMENKMEIPEPFINMYSGQLRLRMPKSLHRQLAIKAHDEGISMNQYCIYLLSMNSLSEK